MVPSKRTQPYRRGKPRVQGATLNAMRRGKPAFMPHPSANKRKLQRRKKRATSLYARLRAYR